MIIAGCDEVGRGPLCGPVVAAAVILDPDYPIAGLTDSKTLSEKRRRVLNEQIMERAIAWKIAEATVEEIDRINILHASMLAMQRAICALSPLPHKVLIDGNRIPDNLPMAAESHIKGDLNIPAISAASIIAKVYRDGLMASLADDYPHYGLEFHKGYPTRQHLEALQEHGPSSIHRRSFGPVKRLLT